MDALHRLLVTRLGLSSVQPRRRLAVVMHGRCLLLDMHMQRQPPLLDEPARHSARLMYSMFHQLAYDHPRPRLSCHMTHVSAESCQQVGDTLQFVGC
jgi:hypothetical protein